MALPSSGPISIADLTVMNAASSTAGPGWILSSDLNSYHGTGFTPPTYDDTKSPGGTFDTCYSNVSSYLNYTYTNTASIFTNLGKIYCVSLQSNSGYIRTSKTCSFSGYVSGSNTYVFQSVPAGSYKIGFNLSGGVSGEQANSIGYIGNSSNQSAYGSTSTGYSSTAVQTALDFTLASSTDVYIKNVISLGLYAAGLYNGFFNFRLMRTN